MTTPRITPLPITALRPEWEATMARIPGKGLKGENAPVNVVGTLMHAPNTLGTFLEYWVTAKQVMKITLIWIGLQPMSARGQTQKVE